MASDPALEYLEKLHRPGLAGGALPRDASEATKQLSQLSRWEAWQLWHEGNIGYSHKGVQHLPAILLPNGCIQADGIMITPPQGFAFARNARVKPQPQRLTRIAVVAFHDETAIRHMLVDKWPASHRCGNPMCINHDHIVVEATPRAWCGQTVVRMPAAQDHVRERPMKRETNFWVMGAIVAIMSICVGALLRRVRQ